MSRVLLLGFKVYSLDVCTPPALPYDLEDLPKRALMSDHVLVISVEKNVFLYNKDQFGVDT